MSIVEFMDRHAFVSLLFVIFFVIQLWMFGGTIADFFRSRRGKKP